MDESAKKYLYKYVRANFWRVAPWIDFDDLVQTGFFAYYETLSRYPEAIEPSHIMNLFMLVLRSKIEDLVRANTKQVDAARSDLLDSIDEFYSKSSDLVPNGWFYDHTEVQLSLMKAPKIVREVLALFSDEAALAELRKTSRRSDGTRETLNARLCRLLGRDPDRVNVVKVTREYFA